mmetsp:Transcript_12058/g.16864  ORF Transcript_12058/g.16864 Transcript_12058/m.16864 type:complete len:90 (-) Transcript_12058:576-845(-)
MYLRKLMIIQLSQMHQLIVYLAVQAAKALIDFFDLVLLAWLAKLDEDETLSCAFEVALALLLKDSTDLLFPSTKASISISVNVNVFGIV